MKNRISILLVLLLFIIESCTIQKEQMGNYNEQPGKEIVYEKGKDIYLFWDQVQLQKVEKNLKTKDYEKIVKRNVFDGIITYGTMGIISFYTVKIKVKETTKKDTD